MVNRITVNIFRGPAAELPADTSTCGIDASCGNHDQIPWRCAGMTHDELKTFYHGAGFNIVEFTVSKVPLVPTWQANPYVHRTGILP